MLKRRIGGDSFWNKQAVGGSLEMAKKKLKISRLVGLI